MRITEAAQRLGISPRMLRYREELGLLPAIRPAAALPRPGPRQHGPPARVQPGRVQPGGPRHRQFTAADLDAAALGLSIEGRYDISPAALAFGVRVLADPRTAALVADFGRRIGRIQPPPARALDFEQERALRLLGLSGARGPRDAAGGSGAGGQEGKGRGRGRPGQDRRGGRPDLEYSGQQRP